jgi:hypothetical protein
MTLRLRLLLLGALLIVSAGCGGYVPSPREEAAPSGRASASTSGKNFTVYVPSREEAALSGRASASTSGKNFTVDDMRDAIIKAGVKSKWHVNDAGADTMEATFVVRGRDTVVVSIPYTATSYAIKYKESAAKWARSLNTAIQRQILLKQTGRDAKRRSGSTDYPP